MSKGEQQTQPNTLVNSIARYTRFVRSTKVGLGLIALLLIGLTLFYPLFRQQSAGVRIQLSGSTSKESAPTTMSNAHFQGLDKDNQPYSMTAKSASDGGTDHVQLVEPTGEILLTSGQHIRVRSESGVFEKKEKLLKLKGKVDISSSQGYTIRTHRMFVDLAHKTAATADELHGAGPLGTIKAYGGAIADETNQFIMFEGPVFVTLNMKPTSGGTKK